MAARRWTIFLRDTHGYPAVGLDVDLNQGGGGPKIHDLTESASQPGCYYGDVDSGSYDLAVDLAVQAEYNGASGFWIQGA